MRKFLVSLALIVISATSVVAQVTNGFASTYPLAYEGTKTASGEVYNSKEYTARHATLPFNTLVKVTNLKNNRSVTVRINDRFNFKNSRVIDISKAASTTINLFGDINPKVKIEVIGMADALMFAAIPKTDVNTTTSQDTELAKKDDTPVKTDKTVAKAEPSLKAETNKATVILPSVKAILPTVSLKDVSNIATITFELITISLFK